VSSRGKLDAGYSGPYVLSE